MKPATLALVLITGIIHAVVSSPLLDQEQVDDADLLAPLSMIRDNLYSRTHYPNAATRDVPNPPPPSFESHDPPPGAPPFGTDPSVVNAWWQKLTPDQQQNYSITAAGYVGSTEGIPIEARDKANTAVLGFTYGDLLAQYNSNSGVDDHTTTKKKLIGISDLATRLFGFAVSGTIDPKNELQHLRGRSVPGPAYLIQFSAEGQGRWVLSVGNPDTASTVVLTVPGVDRGLNDALYQDLSNNDATTDELIKLGLQPSQSAQIIWVGYDSPSVPVDITVNNAAGAAPALQAFQRGLQATRNTGSSPPHITVVGHSFGSVVVAETTLNGRQLIADDVIFIGSPGVPVDNAMTLVRNSVTSSSHGTTRVWAGITGQDCVQCLLPAVRLGKFPTDPEFNATVFATDPNGDHGGYWQGVGLTNMGNIETGKQTAVTSAKSGPPSCPNWTSLTCIVKAVL